MKGKVAIVTGGGSGLGEAIGKALAARGVKVVLSEFNLKWADRVAREITAAGGTASAVEQDAARPEDSAKVVNYALESHGALHYAVNNAGIGGAQAPAGETDLTDWARVIDINLNGVLYGMRYQIPAMLQTGAPACHRQHGVDPWDGRRHRPRRVHGGQTRCRRAHQERRGRAEPPVIGFVGRLGRCMAGLSTAAESHFTGGIMRQAIRRLTVTVVAGAALACGGTPEQSPREEAAQGASADPKAVCSLLTAEDITAVMGIAPGDPRFESNQCIWPRGDRPEELLVQLMVAPPSYRSYDDLAKAYREQMDGADPAQAMEPLDGVGVGRFAVGFREMPMVQIYTDRALVQVATFGNKREHALELATRVARKRE